MPILIPVVMLRRYGTPIAAAEQDPDQVYEISSLKQYESLIEEIQSAGDSVDFADMQGRHISADKARKMVINNDVKAKISANNVAKRTWRGVLFMIVGAALLLSTDPSFLQVVFGAAGIILGSADVGYAQRERDGEFKPWW
jgi:hypothetical protein